MKNPYYCALFKKIAEKTSDISDFYDQVATVKLFPVMVLTSINVSKTPQDIGTAMSETAYF